MEHDLESPAGAIISDDGVYRYVLWRRWDDGPRLTYAMINPSTADAAKDDATIRRCINLAKRDGYGAIDVVNLFAFRTSKPKIMLEAHKKGLDICGPENKQWIFDVLSTSELAVAAWGAWWTGVPVAHRPPRLNFEQFARDMHVPLRCLGRSKDGSPRHPLMVEKDQPFEEYS